MLTGFINVCRVVWYLIWGTLCFCKSKTTEAKRGGLSAIWPVLCCWLIITVASTLPSSTLYVIRQSEQKWKYSILRFFMSPKGTSAFVPNNFFYCRCYSCTGAAAAAGRHMKAESNISTVIHFYFWKQEIV